MRERNVGPYFPSSLSSFCPFSPNIRPPSTCLHFIFEMKVPSQSLVSRHLSASSLSVATAILLGLLPDLSADVLPLPRSKLIPKVWSISSSALKIELGLQSAPRRK